MRPVLIIYPVLWVVSIILAALGAFAEEWSVVVFALILGAISGLGMISEFNRANKSRK